MRQRHIPWADDFLTEHDWLVLPAPEQYQNKWHNWFANTNPIHLEIGTGKGQFISTMAAQYPDINFIGIEVSKNITVKAAKKVLRADCGNVVLLNENAERLDQLFGSGEVSTIYMNFSDPWPKNRHEKRRLTFHTFLKQYKQILAPDGEIIFKTDNRSFFEYSLVSFSSFDMKLVEVNIDLHAISDPYNVMTEYEEKFAAKGQPIYRCRIAFKES